MSIFVLVLCTPTLSNAAISVTPYVSTSPVVAMGPGPVVICDAISGTLRYGQSDPVFPKEITILQDFLNQHGYLSATATGYFGPLTLQAVKAFQAKNGLEADGIVGVQTEAHIKAVACPPNGILPAANAPTISAITPITGATGTTVAISGSGFTASNIIHFSAGGIGNVPSSNNGTLITFTVPSSIGAYCAPNVACPMFMELLNAGTYPVSVENANGLSGAASFTVTGNANQIPG